ncbi:hypothetical protein [Paraburkholderia caledonica]|uniref:hypothetical protein n=1 Tax=Paraburkholderia caledonica TaxID=134536 RepID=UPI0038BBC40E
MEPRRMCGREIRGHLLGVYGLEVSPERIPTGTGEVLAEAAQWQHLPLRKGLKMPPVT